MHVPETCPVDDIFSHDTGPEADSRPSTHTHSYPVCVELITPQEINEGKRPASPLEKDKGAQGGSKKTCSFCDEKTDVQSKQDL